VGGCPHIKWRCRLHCIIQKNRGRKTLVFRLHLFVVLPCEWWGRTFLNHSNIEAVPNRRQPGDSPRTTKQTLVRPCMLVVKSRALSTILVCFGCSDEGITIRTLSSNHMSCSKSCMKLTPTATARGGDSHQRYREPAHAH
jgi:hypothetical protein